MMSAQLKIPAFYVVCPVCGATSGNPCTRARKVGGRLLYRTTATFHAKRIKFSKSPTLPSTEESKPDDNED